MKNAVSEIRKAIINKLVADAGLQSLVGTRVYQKAPSDVVFPYVIYHRNDSQEWDTGETGTQTGFGLQHNIIIHVFDNEEGTVDIESIQVRIFEILQYATNLILQDHLVISCRRILEDVSEDPDGKGYQGTSIYRVITEENL